MNKVLFVRSNRRGAIESAIASSLISRGIRAEDYSLDDTDAERILIVGRIYPVAEQVQELSKRTGTIPPIRLWFTEQVPDPQLDKPLAKQLAQLSIRVVSTSLGRNLLGGRIRGVGEIAALNKWANKLLKVHTFSDTNTEYLKCFGIPTITTPMGSDPRLGHRSEIPFGERNNQVTFIGSTSDGRRGPIIRMLGVDLKKRGIGVTVRTERNPVYAEHRTSLLADTKVFLSVARQPWDDHVYRLLMGGANRVLVVAERIRPSSRGGFVPGIDFVEAELGSISTTIRYYLDHLDEAELFANSLHRKVNELSLTHQIDKVLE